MLLKDIPTFFCQKDIEKLVAFVDTRYSKIKISFTLMSKNSRKIE
jgi:hypothetical protein